MDVKERLVELLLQEDGLCKIDECKDCNANGSCYYYRAADRIIANGVTVQEWKPISEPPKERGCYLVSVKHWLDGKPVTREAKWNGADWLSCYKAEEITPRVTHWTYLPQPPKGE